MVNITTWTLINILKSCVAIPLFWRESVLPTSSLRFSWHLCARPLLIFASRVSDLWVLLEVSQSNAKTWEWSNLISLAWKSVSTLPAPLRLIFFFHISFSDLFNSTSLMQLCGVTSSLMLIAYVVISSLGSVHTWLALPDVPLLLPAHVWSYRGRLEFVSSRGCL